MKIFKSDNPAKFDEILLAYTRGRIFDALNPRTNEIDICFETNRHQSELLSNKIRLRDIFDEVWTMTEMYDQLSHVYNTLMRKYDWSEVECRSMLRYLHLNHPLNENGNQITLKNWKKYRNKELVYQEFMNDATLKTPTYSPDFVMSKMMVDNTKIVDISKVLDSTFVFPTMQIGKPVTN